MIEGPNFKLLCCIEQKIECLAPVGGNLFDIRLKLILLF